MCDTSSAVCKEFREMKDFMKIWFTRFERSFDHQNHQLQELNEKFDNQNKKIDEIQSYIRRQAPNVLCNNGNSSIRSHVTKESLPDVEKSANFVSDFHSCKVKQEAIDISEGTHCTTGGYSETERSGDGNSFPVYPGDGIGTCNDDEEEEENSSTEFVEDECNPRTSSNDEDDDDYVNVEKKRKTVSGRLSGEMPSIASTSLKWSSFATHLLRNRILYPTTKTSSSPKHKPSLSNVQRSTIAVGAKHIEQQAPSLFSEINFNKKRLGISKKRKTALKRCMQEFAYQKDAPVFRSAPVGGFSIENLLSNVPVAETLNMNEQQDSYCGLSDPGLEDDHNISYDEGHNEGTMKTYSEIKVALKNKVDDRSNSNTSIDGAAWPTDNSCDKNESLLSASSQNISASLSNNVQLAETLNTIQDMNYPTVYECYNYWGDLFVKHEAAIVRFLMKKGSGFTFRFISKMRYIPSIANRSVVTMAEAFCLKMEEYGFGEIERHVTLSRCVFRKKKFADMSTDAKTRFQRMAIDKFAYDETFLFGIFDTTNVPKSSV